MAKIPKEPYTIEELANALLELPDDFKKLPCPDIGFFLENHRAIVLTHPERKITYYVFGKWMEL